MDRVRNAGITLGILLACIWGWSEVDPLPLFQLGASQWLLFGSIMAFCVGIFASLTRYMAYVRAHASYFCIVTPFFRVNVAYQRIYSVHPVLLQQLFSTTRSSWAERKFLEPFYGKTALLIELKRYPLPPAILRLFLPSQMLSPRSTGFVILVPDWMKFSTELDSLQGRWLQAQGLRRRAAGPA